MKRKIIKIDENKCNGCRKCVDACHEGAIEMIDGKAKLVSDKYCDGLGDCLPACPTDAIKIIEREAKAYDDEAVKRRMKNRKVSKGCPGTLSKKLKENSNVDKVKKEKTSELSSWPIQLKLINPRADYLEGADLLVAADCTAFSYGNFHEDFIKNHVTVIGCPKLDDNNYYEEKLTEILSINNIKSIKVVRMEVPCCSGIISSVKRAILNSKNIVPYKEVVIGINGEIK